MTCAAGAARSEKGAPARTRRAHDSYSTKAAGSKVVGCACCVAAAGRTRHLSQRQRGRMKPMARVRVREGAYHLEQLGGCSAVAQYGAARRRLPKILLDLGCFFVQGLLALSASSVRVRPKPACLQGRVLPHICPAWPSGRTRSSPRAAKAARRSCALDRRLPLNRFLSLLRPPPAPALSSSMDILDTRARWGAQRGPVLAQGVVRRQGAVHLRRPQCREDVREPDAGDEYAAPPTPRPAAAGAACAAPRDRGAPQRRRPPPAARPVVPGRIR